MGDTLFWIVVLLGGMVWFILRRSRLMQLLRDGSRPEAWAWPEYLPPELDPAERDPAPCAVLTVADGKLAAAEADVVFFREQQDRLFSLLDVAEAERDGSPYGSKSWQTWQRKVITLEGQIHTTQRKLDKAKLDAAILTERLAG